MKRMSGIVVPMVTPFDGKDRVDLDAADRLTDYLIDSGVNGLYPCGTTGEMLKMTSEERMVFSKEVIDHAAGRIPVFVQIGASTTAESIRLAKHAVESGADGIGVVTPQFFGVNDREMVTYFSSIASSVPSDFPVYLYGIPQCAANDISIRAVTELLEKHSNIVGIKYSFADFMRLREYLLFRDKGFDVIIGPDKLILPALSMGCKGTVSGCTQCFPAPFTELWKAYCEGDMQKALDASIKSTELCDVVKAGANIAYFKAALAINGVIDTHMRAPGLDLTKEEMENLRKSLENYKEKYGY